MRGRATKPRDRTSSSLVRAGAARDVFCGGIYSVRGGCSSLLLDLPLSLLSLSCVETTDVDDNADVLCKEQKRVILGLDVSNADYSELLQRPCVVGSCGL